MTDFLEGYTFCTSQSHLIPRTFCTICDAEDCPAGQGGEEKQPDSEDSQIPAEAPKIDKGAAGWRGARVKIIYCLKNRGKVRFRMPGCDNGLGLV